jgi:hypothetical protein
MRRLPNRVLLERAVDGVSGQLRIGTQRLVSCLTELACETGTVEPFDACVVADLNTLRERALRDDNAGAFVAAD